MTFLHFDDLPEIERIPGFHGKFIHTDHLTYAVWEVDAGSAAPLHAHEHEQITSVETGEFEFTLDDETRILTAGMAVVIPSNHVHSGRALSDCRLVDVFYPVRQD
jgi:quercetin dioxygenase-like cupin family protein